MPRALIYSAHAGPEMTIAALLVGADGVLRKRAPLGALCGEIRVLADGGMAVPPLPASAMAALGARLDPDDARLCGMLIDGASRREIAAAVHTERLKDVRAVALDGLLADHQRGGDLLVAPSRGNALAPRAAARESNGVRATFTTRPDRVNRPLPTPLPVASLPPTR